MNLIILTDRDRCGENRFCLTDHRAEHVRAILKAVPGDPIEVGLLNGPQGRGRIEKVTADEVMISCDNWREITATIPEIDLICALPRPQTLKKVLITSAMMGVRSLFFVRAHRVEKSYFQSPLIQPDNQLPYLLEGLAQGKLTRLPRVSVHDRFRPFFEDDLPGPAKSSMRLLCSPDTAATLDAVLVRDARELVVAVGPEGGWVPFELELMQGAGFRPFTLGRWTLRVEHAITAALAQIELVRLR